MRVIAGGILSPEFPAVLDTGHSHNFSIAERHLREWAQLQLVPQRSIRVNGRPVPVVAADLDLEGIRLTLPEGIAVFPENHPGATRLPLLGLRAMIHNGLRVVIDGNRHKVSIHKPWHLWKWKS